MSILDRRFKKAFEKDLKESLDPSVELDEKVKVLLDKYFEEKDKGKLIPKGTSVTLFCCTHDRDSKSSEKIVLEEDTFEYELEELAEEFFQSNKEPEYWFTINAGNEEED